MSRIAMFRTPRFLMPALAAVALAGCAALTPPAGPAAGSRPTPDAAPRPAAAGSAPAAPGTPGAAPATGQPQPFATVTKDAKQVASGLFPVWQKDDKFWLELKPTDFGRPLFLSP